MASASPSLDVRLSSFLLSLRASTAASPYFMRLLLMRPLVCRRLPERLSDSGLACRDSLQASLSHFPASWVQGFSVSLSIEGQNPIARSRVQHQPSRADCERLKEAVTHHQQQQQQQSGDRRAPASGYSSPWFLPLSLSLVLHICCCRDSFRESAFA